MVEKKFADSDETLLKNLAFGSVLILLVNAILQLACLLGYIFPVEFRKRNASVGFQNFLIMLQGW